MSYIYDIDIVFWQGSSGAKSKMELHNSATVQSDVSTTTTDMVEDGMISFHHTDRLTADRLTADRLT